ncbi:uncharacterized protein LOC131256344 [Magnolia sinica]|uniref:uncharacterized protein LOC131256344 n=1 Tax=Magnolia sinica TaxID=86752 RepID=UPI002658D99B|nr:uncharacterized protein LOC131256344 [Magnolia sinica]
MRDFVTSQEPGPVDFYKETHCRQATGSWEEMDTLRSQPTPDGTQRSEPEILSQVLGIHSGYVRGFGHGAKLMALARAASSRSIVVGDSVVRRAVTAKRERSSSYGSSSMTSKISWTGRGRSRRGGWRRCGWSMSDG